MWLIGASKVGTDPRGKLFGSKQSVMLDHIPFGMDPFGFNGIEPGTFRGQKQRQNTHTLSLSFDQTVVLSDPGPHHLAHVKGGIIERLNSQEVLF
jgi:hypothetical protein